MNEHIKRDTTTINYYVHGIRKPYPRRHAILEIAMICCRGGYIYILQCRAFSRSCLNLCSCFCVFVALALPREIIFGACRALSLCAPPVFIFRLSLQLIIYDMNEKHQSGARCKYYTKDSTLCHSTHLQVWCVCFASIRTEYLVSGSPFVLVQVYAVGTLAVIV